MTLKGKSLIHETAFFSSYSYQVSKATSQGYQLGCEICSLNSDYYSVEMDPSTSLRKKLHSHVQIAYSKESKRCFSLLSEAEPYTHSKHLP